MLSDLKWLIVLLAFTALIFSNSLGNSFVWEDKNLLLENRYIKNLSYSGKFFSPFYWKQGQPLQPRYRPIRLLTFSLDYKVWGYRPFGYHLTNLALHSANVALLYLLGLALFKSRFIALSSAFFFAAHPAHVESVSYIKNRTDLLSMFFILFAAIFFIKVLPGSLKEEAGRLGPKKLLLLIASLTSFVLALLSKEMAISLPLILLTYVLLMRGDDMKTKAKELVFILPFVAIGGFLLNWMRQIASSGGLQHAQLPQITLSARIGTVFKTYLYYFKILLLPNNFNADTVFSLPQSFFQAEAIIFLMGLFALLLILIVLASFPRRIIFGLFWLLAALLPVANIAIIYGRPVAEQRVYIPSAGFAFLLALVLYESGYRRGAKATGPLLNKCALVITVAIVLFYSGITLKRNTVWKDDLTLWTDTIAKSPLLGRVHHNMADTYKEKGLIDEALKEYRISLAINPTYDDSHYNLGNLYKDIGSVDRAVAQYKTALKLNPVSAKANNNLGTSYISMGLVDLAIEQFKRALEIDPDLSEARNNLGSAYKQKGMGEQALKELKGALRVDPSMAEPHLNLGGIYAGNALLDKSITEYKIALNVNRAAVEAYLGLAATYGKKKDYVRSAALLERAKIFGLKSPELLLGLAGALRDSFQNDKAIYQYLSFALGNAGELDKVYSGLGLTFKQIGGLDKALDFTTRAARIDPSLAEPRNTLGVLFAKKGHRDKAVLEFLRAEQIDPSLAAPRYNLGILTAQLDRTDRAVAQYLSAIKIDDSYHDAYLNLGNIYQRKGLGPMAKRIYYAGLANSPDSALLHKAIGLLFLNALKEPAEAVRHLTMSLQVDPAQAEAAQLRATIEQIKPR